ncbi:type VII secretion-associated protein [Mycobacterium sp. ITM-2016-00318]|uniref:type VII secretion-associated protein n=1 Tax=Mycobacterium sp. ITM-2016-00318 TaxID=2099693 RepID=UPI001304DA15|nr:type VII secretion-associated protein [Mycobacterium sp. ITM-2016-00318]WNG93964.1 type VII secretion-associated protein [Mycobacterium sp. ITM-2016-00318]
MTTALECIDDEIAIVDDAPVAVTALWREVFHAALPDGAASAVLVCPTWWPTTRVECVREAAEARSAEVTVLQRAEALGRTAPAGSIVIEIAPEFVVTICAGDVVAADPRLGETSDVARSVAEHIGRPTAVLVDAPKGVVGAVELAGAICRHLCTDGVSATTVHPDRVLRPSEKPPHASYVTEAARWKRGRPAVRAGLVGSVSMTVLCLGLALGSNEPNPMSTPMTLLVEGRVALKVPALWAVRRITSGPGSARVQVTAPDGSSAVLVTQSRVKKGETLTTTAAALRSALGDQDAGVFSRFNPDDRRANRTAVTYREIRGARQIDWTVLVDDTVRIGVGCQSAHGDDDAVRLVCDEAIRSVHAIF